MTHRDAAGCARANTSVDTTSRGRRVGWLRPAIERLVCSLAGIDGAATHIAANGSISSIVVTPAAGVAEHQIIQNVTSALLAGLGIALDPARVVLGTSPAAAASVGPEESRGRAVVPRSQALTQPAPPAALAGDGTGQPPSLVQERSNQGEAVHGGHGIAATPRDRSRPRDYVTHVQAGGAPRAEVSAGARGNGYPSTRARVPGETRSRFTTASRGNALSVRHDAAPFGHGANNRTSGHSFERQPNDSTPIQSPPKVGRAEDAGPHEVARSRNGDPARLAPHHNDDQTTATVDGANAGSPAGPRIELVELQRVDTQLRCRVVMALADIRFVAIADGANVPGADVDLPARAAADALRTARTPATPIQLEGAVLTDIGGARHVVAALRIWTGDSFEPAAGAAPVEGSVAEAAAAAVLHAATSRPSRSANA